MRKFARVLALVLVVVASVVGLMNVPDELRKLGGTWLQQSVAFGSALHSVLGIIAVAAILRGWSWAANAAIAWTIAVVYTASVASVAWESPRDGGVLVGGVAAGLSCALIGWWFVWAARTWRKPHIPATSDSPSSTR